MSDIGIFKFGRNKVLWRLTPKNYIDTFRLLNYGGKFSVDWGDGTIIEYAANIGGAVVPTGIITITSDDDNLTRITVGRGVGENRAINAEVVYCGSMTSFEDSFRDQELTSFSINDTSGITNWDYAFENITELTSFPSNLDTSGGTSFDYAFARCTAITDFPAIDISSTTTLKNAWRNCSSLTSFPLIDTSAVTDFSGAWSDCGLTSFPLLDTGAGTNFSGAWRNCASLSSFPALDFSSGQIFSFAWKECAGLTSFPSSCDFTSATTMGGAFSESGLASFPAYTFTACTSFNSMFKDCGDLVTVGALGTEAGTSFSYMFELCQNLESIAALDTTSTTGSSTDMFRLCAPDSPDSTEQAALASPSGYDYN